MNSLLPSPISSHAAEDIEASGGVSVSQRATRQPERGLRELMQFCVTPPASQNDQLLAKRCDIGVHRIGGAQQIVGAERNIEPASTAAHVHLVEELCRFVDNGL